jgi:hypothetical protein
MVVVADIGPSRNFLGIRVAGTCQVGDGDDEAGREQLLALVALAFLVHAITSFRELRDYLLSPTAGFNADLLALVQASRRGRPDSDDPVGEPRADEATLTNIRQFDRFWRAQGRHIEAWFGRATGGSSLVEAGRILISTVMRRRAALP